MNILLAMSVFRRVAETGHFSAVAKEMNLSQPTVSKHVAALEKHLGVKLISRSTRQLSLTEAGRDYHERCVRILDEVTAAEASVHNQRSDLSGSLRISAPVNFGELHVAPHLWRFLVRYPKLKIDLVLDDHYMDLIKEGIDVAIRVGPLSDSSLVMRKIGLFQRVTVASPAYLAANGTPNTLEDLKQHNCIVFSLLAPKNQWQFLGPKGMEKIQVHGDFSTNNPRSMLEAALTGVGIAVLPSWLIGESITQGKLQVLLEDHKPTPMEIHALYPERRYVAEKVRYFIEYLKEKLKPDML